VEVQMSSRASAENLIVDLKKEMSRAFETKLDERSLKYERARYVHALKAISTFFDQVEARSHGEHFYRLALALDDLSHGTVDPLLRPVDTGGTKKHNASWAWCARAHISLGIFALLKAGLTRAAAAKYAATEFPKIKELAGLNRKIPSSTETKVLSWFDDFSKGGRSKIKNRQALAIFASGQQDIEKSPDANGLHRIAKRLFALAVKSVRD
jgi:hypothetical protein